MAMTLTPGKRLSCQPVDRVADDMAAGFDAAVVSIDSLEGLQFRGRGVVEIAFDVVMQRGLVVLDGEQVVGTALKDCGGNLGLAPHGVDGPAFRHVHVP